MPFDLEDDLAPPVNDVDPLDGYFREQNAQRAATIAMRKSSPDVAARANQIARETGLPPSTVERRIGDFEARERGEKTRKLMDRYPVLIPWVSDERNAAVAQDDYDNLSVLGKLWYGTKNIGGTLKSGVYTGTAGLYGAIETAARVEDEYSPTQWAQRKLFGNSMAGAVGDFASRQRKSGEAMAKAADPVVDNYVARNLLIGVKSLPVTAIGITAGLVTGNPATSALVMGGSVGGGEAARALDAGKSPIQAAIYGTSQGAIEYVTEKLPASQLLADIAKKTPFAQLFIGQLTREIPGEQVATVLQDLNEWAVLNPEKPFMDYVRERPEAALSTAIATIGGVGATSIATRSAQVALDTTGKVVNRVARGRAAQANAEFLDKLGEAATASKTRGRDPQAYESLIAELAKDGSAENIYIPAEKVREYLQSTDWDSAEFWQEYDQDIADGTISNGDVVIPIAKAAAHLAGTPAWEALKGDMRLSPGGESINEAKASEGALDDDMAAMGESISQQHEAAVKADEPRQKLIESVITKLTNAGHRLADARKEAELVANTAASRAADFGTELTGNEFDDVAVNQVLPAGLAPMVAADNLSLVVKAMRSGGKQRSGKAKFGPSLIDFIRSKGGIDDTGGDLEAIGFGKLKGISQKGQTKLIRKSRGNVVAAAGPSLIGSDGQQNSNTPDELAMRAWEAGYFPEFTERPSVNDLLDALSEGNSGRHRYVADNENGAQTEQMRMAAQDLYQILDQQGIDPDKATDKEIKAAVERFQEQASGRSLDQSKPVATLKGDEIAPLDTHGKELRDAAKAWFKQHLQGKVFPSTALHGEVHFAGSRKPISSSADERKLRLFAALPEIVGTSRLIDSQPPRDASERTKAWHYLRGQVVLNGEAVEVTTSVREDVNGNFYYNHVIEESPASDSSDPAREAGGGTEGRAYDQSISANDDQINMDVRPVGRELFQPAYHGSRYDGDGTYNYVVFDDNAVSIRAYEQSFSDGPRGRVTFKEGGKAVIDLFAESNASTFIHEMGHVWLEQLQADAALPDGPQRRKDMWATVEAWFKDNGHVIGADGIIPTEAHELWARGVERFTMEGKAPSSILRKAFKAFQSWMVDIYKIAENLKAPITPEIRDVMARLFATDEEIAQAHEEQNLKALFDSVESAAKFGMNEAAYKDYVKAATEAKDEAFDRLLFKTMETVRRQRTKEYQDERAAVEADVRQSVDGRPVWRALAAVSAKGGVRLDKQALIENYGEDILTQLPRYIPPIFKDGGTDADTIAELNGFSTGDEMVKALVGVADRRAALKEGGDKRSARQSVIDEETDAIMKERYGDPLSDGSIQEEALALIHNDKQGELQATELRVLSARTSQPSKPTPYRIARLWASDKVRGGIVRDVASRSAIQRYLKAASKAGKAAEQAYMAGDTDEAFKQKQAQMLNNALVAEAKQAADEIDIAVARMSRLAKRRTIKSMDQDYLERIHALLEQVDLKQRSQTSIDRQGSFEAWRAEQEALGHDIVTPEGFVETLGKTHWSRLSVENLLVLDETIKQIAHLGRMKQTLLDGKERREFDAIVAEGIVSAGNLKGNPPSDLMAPSWGDSIKGKVLSLDAALLKMETLCDWLDGGDPNGVFNRIVFRPIANAQSRAFVMSQDYGQRIADTIKALPDGHLKRWRDKIVMPELLNEKTGKPWVMTRMNLISMALNMGNEGNIQRLKDGYSWNEDAVRDVLNREMTATDWQFVQEVWDIIDTLWPEAAALERRVNGIEPDKIEAVPFVTPHGTFRGGYYPAVYDATKKKPGKRHGSGVGGAAGDLFIEGYSRPTTRASSTKERADKVSRPIKLDLTVINQHVTEIIHDITHREAVMQADKFLSDGRVEDAIVEALNPQIYAQMRPWVKYVANQWVHEKAGTEGFLWFLSAMRANATFVGLALRVSTTKLQIAGLVNSQEVVGGKWVSEASAMFAKSPIETGQFVLEKSTEVKSRLDNLDRDMRSQILAMEGKSGRVSEARRFAFHGIGYADRLVSVPTWLGAYNKALFEQMSEEDAVYAADKVVRQSQGANAPKDMAAIVRGEGPAGQLLKFLTMFYSYMSAKYQRDRTLARDTMDADPTRRPRDFGNLLARGFYLFVVAALLPLWMAGRGPDDEEDIESWADWAWRGMLFAGVGTLPLVRDVVPIATKRAIDDKSFGYQLSPAAGGPMAVINVAGDIGNIIEGEDTKRATRNALNLAGYATGLVPDQLAASAQFIVDVNEGDQEPQGVLDWLEGLEKGKVKED